MNHVIIHQFNTRLIVSTALVSLFFLASCSAPSQKETLKIAVSSNLEPAIDSICEIFEIETGIHCELNSNSTGMLANQIEQGAPFDLFVSAKMTISEDLFKRSFSEKPIHFSNGSLILVYRSTIQTTEYKSILKNTETKRISIADPKSATYGEAAMAFLKNDGIYNELKPKLVYGDNIEQVNHYLLSNAVDAAFTSNSFIESIPVGFNYLIISDTTHPAIKQGISILNHGKKSQPEASKQFLAYFSNAKSKAILKHFGYGILP